MYRTTCIAEDRKRLSALFLAALVLILTVICTQRAYAAVVVPNQLRSTYSIPPGGQSSDLAISSGAWNGHVMITGTVRTPPYEAVGVLHATYTSSSQGLTWAGIHAAGSGAGLSQGYTYSTSGNVPLVEVGYAASAVLETGGASSATNYPNKVRIQNYSGSTLSCMLDMIW